VLGRAVVGHYAAAQQEAGEFAAAAGDAVVAVDAGEAGIGERVLLTMEGFSAFSSVGRPMTPIEMAVIGIIDHIELLPEMSN
jgi:microcompartment protein CcmK/EutM